MLLKLHFLTGMRTDDGPNILSLKIKLTDKLNKKKIIKLFRKYFFVSPRTFHQVTPFPNFHAKCMFLSNKTMSEKFNLMNCNDIIFKPIVQ